MSKMETVDNETERIEALAGMLETLMIQFDLISMDVPLLERTIESLKARISHNNASLTVITALGGFYDSTEDRCKVRVAELILEIINERNKMKEAQQKTRVNEQKRSELRELFGL